MKISRREFLKWTIAATAALKLNLDVEGINTVMAEESDPPVIWLQGAGCAGCFISTLNVTNPATIDNVLMNKISLKFNSTVMSSSGEQAMTSLETAANNYKDQFILVVDGAVPTGDKSSFCIVGEHSGNKMTMEDAILKFGTMAKWVVSAGTCASFGGVTASAPNPSNSASVLSLLKGKTRNPIINLPGCPVNPTMIIQTLLDVILSNAPALDSYNRPTKYYSITVHDNCPRNGGPSATQVGQSGCFQPQGCMGPLTDNACPSLKWNNGRSWCVDVNYPCIGCSSPTFPTNPLLSSE